MLRKIVVILTMLLCSMATQLHGLELGALTLESALNQPLRMRIELLQLGDAQLQDIRVSVASETDFERFNIARDSFLSNIVFTVESQGQDNVVILTSSQTVLESSLSFILDTRWPNGRQLSEYTVLLDPPVFDDQQSTAEIRAPISPILRPFTSAEAASDEPFVEPDDSEPGIVDQETIEVDRGDTLSGIARQVRPNTELSIQQTMLALQRLNPDAFSDGNINRLFSGQVLRVPTLAEILSIDPSDAVEEVTRQNQDFAEVDVQPLTATSGATPGQDDLPQGQLSVVSGDDERIGAAALGDTENAVLDQRIAELETQLAQREEEVDRVRIEREELDSRMADLDTQIEAAQEIIRLQDIQLAQLQDSLNAAAARFIAEQQAIQDAAEAEAALLSNSSSSLTDDVMRILTANSRFLLFGIALLILLLVVLMQRRNRTAKTSEDDIDEMAGHDFDTGAGEADVKFSEVEGLLEAKENKSVTANEEETVNSESEANNEPVSTVKIEAVPAEAEEVDMMFDLGSDDDPTRDVKISEAADEDLEFLPNDDAEIEAFDDAEEADMLSADDETATKLELAYAYHKMGDMEGAKEILNEVIEEGSDEQAEEAGKLLGSLDAKSD